MARSAGIYVIVDWHIHEAVPTKGEAIAFFKQIAQDYGKYPHVIYEDWNEPLQVLFTGRGAPTSQLRWTGTR